MHIFMYFSASFYPHYIIIMVKGLLIHPLLETQMQLVVYGKQSLDTLRQWVNNSFSEVPNRGVTTPTFNTTSFPPNSSYSGQLVHYYPVADITQLSIYWQTDPLEKKYRNAVASFLARYIGHEGEGSLLQYFREKDWANALSAGAEV